MCVYMYVCVCVYTHHFFFIHLSADGHLGCFHSLAIVNNATVNIGVHVTFRISGFGFFSDTYSGVELLGPMVVLFLVFENPPYCFHSGCASLHSHQKYTRVPFSPHPHQHLLFVVFVIIAILIDLS